MKTKVTSWNGIVYESPCDIKVGQIWYNKEENRTALIVKIRDELGDSGDMLPVVYWFSNDFMNRDCLYACRHGFFQDNGYVLAK